MGDNIYNLFLLENILQKNTPGVKYATILSMNMNKGDTTKHFRRELIKTIKIKEKLQENNN